MTTKQAQPPKDDSLEEEELENAMARLNELHIQLRQLRRTLPRMLEPLQVKQPSPQVMFTAFSNSVENTRKEIASFKQAINSEESKKVFQKTIESRRANSMGIKPWRYRDYPDWTTAKRRKQDPQD